MTLISGAFVSLGLLTAGGLAWLAAALVQPSRTRHPDAPIDPRIRLTPFREDEGEAGGASELDSSLNDLPTPVGGLHRDLDTPFVATVTDEDTLLSLDSGAVAPLDAIGEATTDLDWELPRVAVSAENESLDSLADLEQAFSDIVPSELEALGALEVPSVSRPQPTASDDSDEPPTPRYLKPLPDEEASNEEVSDMINHFADERAIDETDDTVDDPEEAALDLRDARLRDIRLLLPGRSMHDVAPLWLDALGLPWPFSADELVDALCNALESDDGRVLSVGALGFYREASPHGRLVLTHALFTRPEPAYGGSLLYTAMLYDDASPDAQNVGAWYMARCGLRDELLRAFGAGPTTRDEAIVSSLYTYYGGVDGVVPHLEEHCISAARYRPMLDKLEEERREIEAEEEGPDSDDEPYSIDADDENANNLAR